ncbi:MAG: 50S ribosomal protein L11 methyltransferase, partial [Paludibacteraceae bacterium]
MKYSVAHFQTSFAEQWQADVFAQALCDIGFDTIDGSDAYIPTTQLDTAALQTLAAQTEGVSLLSVEDCPDENWNAVWESEHPAEQLPMGVVIIPHCAFGAGHHETTGMLIDALMERDWTGCRVLDNGCGTGVLGIFAAKRGAESVLAIDIDDKSVENTRENIARNGVTIEAQQGTLEALADDFERPDRVTCGISVCANELPRPASFIPIYRDGEGAGGGENNDCTSTGQGLDSQIVNGQIVQYTPPFDLILSNIHRNILLSQLP